MPSRREVPKSTPIRLDVGIRQVLPVDERVAVVIFECACAAEVVFDGDGVYNLREPVAVCETHTSLQLMRVRKPLPPPRRSL